jgi:hypothetical protein
MYWFHLRETQNIVTKTDDVLATALTVTAAVIIE